MKLNSLFTGRIGRPKGRNFFGSQPTRDEFCHKKNPILWLLRFFDMLLATLWALCTKNPLELVDLESVEICDRTQNWYFFVMIDFFSREWNSLQSIVSKQIKPKLQNIVRKVPRFLNEMSYEVWDQRSLHIYVPIASKTVFIFGNLPTKPPFWKRLPLNHNQFKKRAVTQNTSEHLVRNRNQ